MVMFPRLDDIRRISDCGGLSLVDHLDGEENKNNYNSPTTSVAQDVDQPSFSTTPSPTSVSNSIRYRFTPRFVAKITTRKRVIRQRSRPFNKKDLQNCESP